MSKLTTPEVKQLEVVVGDTLAEWSGLKAQKRRRHEFNVFVYGWKIGKLPTLDVKSSRFKFYTGSKVPDSLDTYKFMVVRLTGPVSMPSVLYQRMEKIGEKIHLYWAINGNLEKSLRGLCKPYAI